MNNFLKFYTENSISPVKQDISNLQKHIDRRIMLYKELGLLNIMINNADVLEVAPGSGYNSIVTAMGKPKSYTLIEPNITGFKEMIKLFSEFNLKSENIHFINSTLEDTNIGQQFDIVICEGLIPALDKKEKLLSILYKNVKIGGLLIITCIDEISVFFDIARRFIARLLTHEISNINEKTNLLSNIFKQHHSSINATRPLKDWILDIFINPAAVSYNDYFSIEEAILKTKKEFYYYNSSPNIFTNISWYKDLKAIPEDFNRNFIKQYNEKKHSLFFKPLEISTREKEKNDELNVLCKKFIKNSYDFENKILSKEDTISIAIKLVSDILDNISDSTIEDKSLEKTLEEYMQILEKPTIEQVSTAKYFPFAYGKAQQYVSFIKDSDL